MDIPNRGHIANLPDGPIVEVPGMVGGDGVRGLAVGNLPEGIAEMCWMQMQLASMAVDAAVMGDRELGAADPDPRPGHAQPQGRQSDPGRTAGRACAIFAAIRLASLKNL